MPALNRVQIIGYLGRDPELRHTPGGTAVATLSVATTRRYKRQGDEDWSEETEWHRVSVWGKRGEAADKILQKGSLVYVQGRLRTQKYDDKGGVTRWVTDVVCEDWQPLARLRSKDDRPDPSELEAPAGHGGFDDDIPF